MSQSSNEAHSSNKVRPLHRSGHDNDQTRAPSDMLRPKIELTGMKLIPWRDIWASLTVAKIRGNGEMIEVFYDTLFKEAIFDDRGAWSIDLRKEN